MLSLEQPFFVARLAGGAATVLIAREAVPQDEAIAKAYELGEASEAQALVDAACVLGEMLPKAASYENPMLRDDWRVAIAKADTPLLVSAPNAVDVDRAAIIAELAKCQLPWILDVGSLTGLRTDAVIAKAWSFKVRGLTRDFVSSMEPPHDPRVIAVVGPGLKSRESTKIEKSARRMKLVRKDQLGEQRIVLGIVLQPEVVDTQGDVYSADEIERAAHTWMEQYLNTGYMHQTLVNEGVRPVESYLCPVDCDIGGEPVKRGTWLLAVHVLSDPLWEQVKAGELTGFSIGGFARRVPAQQMGE